MKMSRSTRTFIEIIEKFARLKVAGKVFSRFAVYADYMVEIFGRLKSLPTFIQILARDP